jgi:uncharacterized membrane-anchored protein
MAVCFHSRRGGGASRGNNLALLETDWLAVLSCCLLACLLACLLCCLLACFAACAPYIYYYCVCGGVGVSLSYLDREARSHRVHADFSFGAWIVKSLFVILQVLKVIIVIIIDQEYLNTRVGIYFIISFMAESTDPVQQAMLHQEV